MSKSLLRIWTGPLPEEELFPHRKINPLLHWFVHPIKRRLAKYYLILLKSVFGLKVIALTGSSGKTTTSNILYSVLSLHQPTIKTRESVTTTYNLPTTILSCTPKTRYLILEMGVEYSGDMNFYTWLAKPDIAILLNISSVHSSYLGSTSDIYAEKSLLLSALPPNGIALINSDDSHINYSGHSRSLRFGSKPGSFSQITSVTLTQNLQTKINIRLAGKATSYLLPLTGRFLASNVAAAAAVFHLLAIPHPIISKGLSQITPPAHRMNIIKLKNGSVILNDAYNANPLSTHESLKTLAEVAKITKNTPVFIFAQMNELGSYERSAHEEIGRLVKKLKINHFYCLGPATAYAIRTAGFGKYFDSFSDLQTAVAPLFNNKSTRPGNGHKTILIKGSNSWHLEKLIIR